VGEWRSVWVRELIDLTVRAPRRLAWGLTIAGLAGCWGIAYALGGAAAFPPDWFYLIVILTGMRFGWRGALVTALASALLAGPLLPASVSTGAAQPTSQWLIHAVFFVAVGQVVALLTSLVRQSLADEFVSLRAERDLRRGLDRGEFRVLYQPIVALDSERIVGVEALVRWDHPVRGVLAPDAFIADAEDSGAIIELGRFVLEETCRQIAAWKRTVLLGVAQFQVAVNVSTHQLQDPAFGTQVAAVIDTTGLDAAWLHLEVTETAVIADLDSACVHLQAIRALGVRIAIDDFGTGYSSLGYLHKLPVDVIKIDRSFVASLGDPGRAGTIANLVAEVASRLHITSVAEGVETRDQALRLRALGCELAQGFYFSRPVDADVIHDLLASAAESGRSSRSEATMNDPEGVTIERNRVTVSLEPAIFDSDAEAAGYVERAVATQMERHVPMRWTGANPVVEWEEPGRGTMRFEEGKGGWQRLSR
jgi:EAL domain-containing protein (putative c-di-GMP-specific phosphodiesterase class I)